MVRADLHCHTTASDGTLEPADLVWRAAAAGLDVVAVTDHDTTAGVSEARAAGVAAGVRIVGGVELSARAGTRTVHVLGYFVEPEAPELAQFLERAARDRERRGRAIVERLRELGYEITFEEVRTRAGRGLVTRPHVARALVARGYVPSVRDAFTPGLLADGGRADVPKNVLEAEEAVRLVRRAGGAAVLAHPAAGHHQGRPRPVDHQLVERLVAAGLAGLEVDHPDHPPLVRDQLRMLARRLDLVCTGGSDFHGEATPLGTCLTSEAELARLEARARAGG